MLPSVLARQLHQGIRDFIGATFPMASPYFRGVMDRFLDKPGNVFKGPYYQFGLPFLPAPEKTHPFASLDLGDFHPYAHQSLAWSRLAGANPQNTLVATGTGSGKTECFLYPILDFCAQNRGPGIKAILIYPMNALADDQARRIASMIASQPGLHGLRAGVYTGAAAEIGNKTMSATELISDRHTLQDYPPDILLTNYKMLDLLLLRPADQKLWNGAQVKYLVVDELHSFDGAQGTDLALLIRRLKERLSGRQTNDWACVGTSATLGGPDSTGALLQFTEDVFQGTFSPSSLVVEHRLTESQFLEGTYISHFELPTTGDSLFLSHSDSDPSGVPYLSRQLALWFPDETWQGTDEDATRAGTLLKGHVVFQNLLRFLDGKPRSQEEVWYHFRKTYSAAKSWSDSFCALVLDSLVALISFARLEAPGGRTVPFLTVRTQFWMRELRRIVASTPALTEGVPGEVELVLADEIPNSKRVFLPIVHCRECHSAGWVTREAPGHAPVIQDLRQIYSGYFGKTTDTMVLYPEGDLRDPQQGSRAQLCPECGFLSLPDSEQCQHCHQKGLLAVAKFFLVNDQGKFSNDCPHCGAAGDLTIVGSKAASLLAALVGQTFSNPFNNDKKLLTFSDSVQDASHRAGFLTARAWTFGFRTAVQQVVQTLETGTSLKDLTQLFVSHWQRTLGSPETFVGTLLPPDLEWLDDYSELTDKGALPRGTRLPEDLVKRLEWELVSEYTFRSRLGRTLERTQTSIAIAMPQLLEASSKALASGLSEKQDRFRAVSVDHHGWRRLLWGIVFRMKNLGAVDSSHLQLLFEKDTSFLVRKFQPYMPPLMPRFPRIVVNQPKGGTTRESLWGSSGRRSWFQVWLGRCLKTLLPNLGLADPTDDMAVLDAAMAALTQVGLLKVMELSKELDGWLLATDNLLVENHVSTAWCDHCGHSVQTTVPELPFIEGMTCLRPECQGVYAVGVRAQSDYYRNLYNRGEVRRINGREHTGLLDGKTRKALEDRFIAGEHPWDPNLLSATPTLEMGINIGDLSTVFLCSVPPAVANFLQRIGRAGRLDGNSFVLVMANAHPHDQYFFQTPAEMIQGRVEPPAIFLGAGEVLQRHLTAFVLAKWLRGLPTTAVPRRVGDVLAQRNKHDAKTLPIGFFEHLMKHHALWFAEFRAIVPHLDDQNPVLMLLEDWIRPDTQGRSLLEVKFLERLDSVVAELSSMSKRRDQMRGQIATLKAVTKLTQPQLDEVEELISEIGAIGKAMSELRNKDTWMFLCDEGFLPNYAFPESGVKLKAVFFRKNKEGSAQAFSYESLELVRSASSALRELAPENTFYGCGRKMTIQRLDMGLSTLETWRFCPNCSHAVEQSHSDFSLTQCPVCRTSGWNDVGQKHNLLRFKQVHSFSSYKESLINDEAEDREPEFYNTKLMVDFDPFDPDNRYFGMEETDYPLAVEFLQRANFRELNFGKSDEREIGFLVAGDKRAKHGFAVCPSCGTLTDKHTPDCPISRTAALGAMVKEVVHLYHQFSSEAIRLLIPIPHLGIDVDKTVQSLIAAMYLGLKGKYGGRVDHLRIIEDQSVSPSGGTLSYLVLYDTIPGGSGYLKEFFSDAKEGGNQTFFEILEKARQALGTCDCQKDPEKDGCYHCVYSHRVSYHIKDVSRAQALAVIDSILQSRRLLVPVDGPSSARVDPLFDSKLEELFLAALKTPPLWPVAMSLSLEFYHGKSGYFVRIGSQEYHLEQQVQISLGGSSHTTPDFVFWPLDSKDRPYLVYLDGFRWHKDKVQYDIETRLTLARKHGYRVFSFSWEDIAAVVEGTDSVLDADGHRWVSHRPRTAANPAKWPGTERPMGVVPLISMLSMERNEREKQWLAQATQNALGALMGSSSKPQDLGILKQATSLTLPDSGYFAEVALPSSANSVWTVVASEVPPGKTLALSGWLVFDDADPIDKLAWNNLLDWMNLSQILPEVRWTTKARPELYAWLASLQPQVRPEAEEWDALSSLTLKSWQPLLEYLRSEEAPLPEIGYEVERADGELACVAEVAWVEQGILVVAREYEDSREQIPATWRIHFWHPDEPFPILDFGVET